MYKEQFQKKLKDTYLSAGLDAEIAAGIATDVVNKMMEFNFSEDQFRQLLPAKLFVDTYDDKNTVARTFTTTKEEQKHINNWIREHAKTCPILSNPATQNWLGSPIHYIFTPCSFCTSIRIQCNCGAEFNVPSDPDLI